jgi:hypothetical protein
MKLWIYTRPINDSQECDQLGGAPPPLASLGLLSGSAEPPFRRPAERSASSPFGRIPFRRADPSRRIERIHTQNFARLPRRAKTLLH